MPSSRGDRFPHEEHNTWSQDNAQKERWAKALDATGTNTMRALLARQQPGSGGTMPIGTEIDVVIGFAQEWLEWHDDREAAAEELRQERMIKATQWAAGAAVAAAVAAIVSALGTGLQAYYAAHPSAQTNSVGMPSGSRPPSPPAR